MILTCEECVLEPGHEGDHVNWGGFKYSTKRDPSRPTDGPRIAKIAAALGKPGMPWQREVWDTARERGVFGELVYEIVLVTVPRQSGKTTLYGPVQLDTCIMNPGVKTFYTAQTGKDARSRFGDLVRLVQESPLDAIVKYRYSAGDEGILFPNNSAYKIFAPVPAALHGETPPLVGMDEIWELDEALGDAILEGAIIPAQVTLYGQRQIWLFSTFGTAESTFLWKWVERGRESVLKPGSHPKLAYFEAGLPDGADPYDRREIARFHPAVGHTISIDALMEISTQVTRPTWLRAFCNIRTETEEPLFSDEHVAALAREPLARPSLSDLAISYAVGAGDHGVVMASWRDLDGRPTSRVLHSAPGTLWMHDLIVDLHRRWRPAVLGADDGGQTRRITDAVRRTLGDEALTLTTGKDFGTACMAWVDLLETNEFAFDGSRAISVGLKHLALRKSGDVIVFDRNGSTGSIAGPEASAVGIWLYDHREIVPTTLKIHV